MAISWVVTVGALGWVALAGFVAMTQSWGVFLAHPLLASLAMMVLVPAALDNIAAKRQIVHSRFALATGSCLYIAFFVMLQVKEWNNKEHFTSYHGKAGLASMVSFFMMQITGGPIYFGYATGGLRKFMAQVHRVMVFLAFPLLSVTLLLGLNSNWFHWILEKDELWWYIALGTVLLVQLGSVLIILRSRVHKRIFSSRPRRN